MSDDLIGLTFHHVGIVVDNIEHSLFHYSALFGKNSISKIYDISSQKVKVCFVQVGRDSYLELVEPTGEESMVYKLLKKRVTYYHAGYKVADILAAVARLEQLHYKPMEIFTSEAFGGKRCVFLFSPEAHLIELIEE